MALLTRYYWHIGGAAQESVGETSGAEQVVQRGDGRGLRWRAGDGVEVSPVGGDQRLTSVRQNEHELQAAAHARVSQQLQGLSLEGVMRAGDGHSLREVPMAGSVWWFPSIESITTN